MPIDALPDKLTELREMDSYGFTSEDKYMVSTTKFYNITSPDPGFQTCPLVDT